MDTSKHGPSTGGAAPGPIAADDLPGVSLGEQPHDPAHCDRDGQPHLGPCADPGDGVTRWTVTRIGLIEALRKGWPGLPLAILARSADTVLGHLPADGESGTRAEAPASGLLSLAAALERRADRIGDHGLTRDGSIRARVLREAAGMARRRAQGGQESPYGDGPVSADTGNGQDATEALSGSALIAAERQRQIIAEGWTPEHDAHHTGGELARAAACYAAPIKAPSEPAHWPPRHWPWRERDWKPGPDRIRELTKAGALIAAEIDRLSAADDDSDLTEDGWPL